MSEEGVSFGVVGVWSLASRVVVKPGTRWVFSVGSCRACG